MSAKSQACQTLPSPPQSWKKGWVLSDLRSTLSLHNVYCITRVVLVDVSCEKANSYSRPDSLNPDSQLLSVALSCSQLLSAALNLSTKFYNEKHFTYFTGNWDVLQQFFCVRFKKSFAKHLSASRASTALPGIILSCLILLMRIMFVHW